VENVLGSQANGDEGERIQRRGKGRKKPQLGFLGGEVVEKRGGTTRKNLTREMSFTWGGGRQRMGRKKTGEESYKENRHCGRPTTGVQKL